MARSASTLILVTITVVMSLIAVGPSSGQEASTKQGGAETPFDPTQTYEIFFSLHPGEIDRLSNIRLLGVERVGLKAYLKFQVLLNNQREEGYIDLQTVSAILPTSRPLITTPEVILDRQPLDEREKIKEIREETVREIIKEPPGPVVVPAPRRER